MKFANHAPLEKRKKKIPDSQNRIPGTSNNAPYVESPSIRNVMERSISNVPIMISIIPVALAKPGALVFIVMFIDYQYVKIYFLTIYLVKMPVLKNLILLLFVGKSIHDLFYSGFINTNAILNNFSVNFSVGG